MDRKIYNGVVNVNQWGDSHVFSISRAINHTAPSGESVTAETAFPSPKNPVPYFYIMPTSQLGTLKVRLLNSQPDEFVELSNETIISNIGIFLPMKVVEIHQDTTLESFVVGI